MRIRAIQPSRILAAVLLLGLGSCDKVPLLAPSESTITVTAPTRVLPINGQTSVTAVVQEKGGQAVQNGTTVRFTASLGRVSPVEVETINGTAITTFFAGETSGLADVQATSGGATGGGGTTATNTIQFTIGAAATDTVSVRTNPSSVSATGGTVDVVAVVLGTNGRALSGVPVTFSANRGTLSSSSAITNANGEATVQLTTNVETTINASAGGKTSATAAVVTVQGSPSITLTCQGSGTSGTSCTQSSGQAVTFTANRGSTTTALTNVTLDFGDGSSASLGTLASPTTITHTYTSTGTFTATLTARDVNGQTTTASVAVTIAPRAPIGVTITATPDAAPNQRRWTFTANVTPSAEAANIQSYEWNFDDGTTATTSGNSTSHVYNETGQQTVTVTVRTTDGRNAVGRTEIIVQ